ncbi:MAG TPA: hypothetical protein VN690_10335 [Terriglobales bacterium]|nr:hypothetical protein [Terriglobales bacterium]
MPPPEPPPDAPPDSLGALRDWLPRQRWYGAKSEAICGVREVDRAGPARIIEVSWRSGEAGRYLLPAIETAAQRRRWFELLAQAARISGGFGEMAGEPLEELAAPGESRLLGAEQSNTSVLYGAPQGRSVLKFIRRLHAGEHPDFEVPRALHAGTAFRNVPQPLGRIVYRAQGMETTLAVLHAFVPNEGDGWNWALASAGMPAEELRQLGKRTSELHAALATAFGTEPIVADDLARWRGRALAAAEAPELAAHAELLKPWRERLRAGEAGIESVAGEAKSRIHGDYHLGQVLRTPSDWVVMDFEGEPARPLEERRQKGSPLQDVAGMLRSFGYAGATLRRPQWEAEAQAAFLAGYGPISATEAVRFFEIEKAVYELRYEINHRPDWVGIPLRALKRLI